MIIGSGILLDIIDYSIGDVLTLSEIAEQVVDRANWENWKKIDTLVVADLKKSEDIAAEVSKSKAIDIQVRINKTLVTFYFRIKLTGEQSDMREI